MKIVSLVIRGVPFDSMGGSGFDPRVFCVFFSVGGEVLFFFAESGILFFEVNYMYILYDAIYYYWYSKLIFGAIIVGLSGGGGGGGYNFKFEI